MNLTHDAMLVSLRINSWSGRLYDRQASQQVAIHHDADTNAGRYNKRLLPKQAFAALAATMSNARTSHNANTVNPGVIISHIPFYQSSTFVHGSLSR